MKEKALTLLILIFIATSITGFTYAHWGDNLQVECTAESGCLCIVFQDPLPDPSDNDDDTTVFPFKDVGEVETSLKDDWICECTGETGKKTMVIEINNAYPSYEAYCGFTIESIGTIPANISEIQIGNPNGELTWDPTKNALVHNPDGGAVINIIIEPFLVGQIIEPGEYLEAQINIHIGEAAEECHTYNFKITIIATEVP